jgi:hypothetical protein
LGITSSRMGHLWDGLAHAYDGGATTLRVYASWTRPADQRAAEILAGDLLELRRQAAGGVTPSPASVLLPVAKPVEDVLAAAPTGCTYVDVAEGVRPAVFEGRLEPLDFVPTVTDLARWFGVARSTAQRAVATLGAEGLIERRGAAEFGHQDTGEVRKRELRLRQYNRLPGVGSGYDFANPTGNWCLENGEIDRLVAWLGTRANLAQGGRYRLLDTTGPRQSCSTC